MRLILRLKQRETILLLIILAAAFALRIFNLGFESFWLDELFSANDCDPHLPLGQMFNVLKCCDQHPPLFYILERGFFTFFGVSETKARILPALAGVASVWAAYLLGKEIVGKRLGLVAAALTCINHFNIYYSREARDYIFACLFATLSFVFFFRLVKYLRTRDMWFYALFALLTIYSHYFGLILVFAEFCAATILFFSAKEKKVFAKRFVISGGVILAGFAIWIPVFLAVTKITTFWIPPLPKNWLRMFFGNYFGDTPDLIHIMAVLLMIYVLAVFARRKWKWPDTDRAALRLSFVIFGTTALITYGLPYVRGLLMTPMLVDRYTIVMLPALLLIIAYAIEIIPFAWLRYAGLGFIIFISVQREIGFLKTYSKHYKTQFREVTAFMASNEEARSGRYPILNDRIAWAESYYVRKFDYPGSLLEAPTSATIDSIVKRTSSKYDVKGFWLMDAHGAGDPGATLDPVSRGKVDSFFVKVDERRFIDSWAQLYRRKASAGGEH